MDTRLRELERQWRATGSWEDEEVFVLARSRETGEALLRMDGLYLSRLEDSAAGHGADAQGEIPVYYLWLRFFPDGVAGVTTIPAEAQLVGEWLALDHPHCSSGEWTQEGARLEFAQADHPGGIGYTISHYRARLRADGSLDVEGKVRPYEDPQPRTYGFQPLPGAGPQGAG